MSDMADGLSYHGANRTSTADEPGKVLEIGEAAKEVAANSDRVFIHLTNYGPVDAYYKYGAGAEKEKGHLLPKEGGSVVITWYVGLVTIAGNGAKVVYSEG